MLGQISEQNAPAKTEYILHIVSKFSTKEKRVQISVRKWSKKKERRKKEKRKKKEKNRAYTQ